VGKFSQSCGVGHLGMDKGSLRSNPAKGLGWVLMWIAHHFGNTAISQVVDAVDKAEAAGVTWIQIFDVLWSIISTIMGGGTISLQDIINAILALINPPAKAAAP